MLHVCLIVLVLLSTTAATAAAQDAALTAIPLHLSTPQLVHFLESVPLRSSEDPAREATGFLDRLKQHKIGVRPLFMLLPTEATEGDETPPPTFAFVARAKGRTFVSLTRPQPRLDSEDRLFFHRLLISDLLRGRRFSLTVYEDHALAKAASGLLGVGGRLTYRPSLEVSGWHLRVDLFGTYAPSDGPTAYLGLAGSRHPSE